MATHNQEYQPSKVKLIETLINQSVVIAWYGSKAYSLATIFIYSANASNVKHNQISFWSTCAVFHTKRVEK